MKTVLSLCLIVLSPIFACGNQEEKPPDFPSDTEIKLVMAEAKHAFEQYGGLVGHGEQLLGKGQFEQDRMLLEHWETTSKTVSQNPQAFNSETGFDALIDLDDAARNTALCADQASTEVLNDINNLHSQRSQLLLELRQSCLNTSRLLFTASENANVLFTRYVTLQKNASAQATDALAKCNEALQKSEKRQP